MLTKTKIDWCDFTWNPVWGCRNNCPYCYARKLAKRFGDPEFLPTWKQKNFDKPFPKKPSRIFVNSMSDVAFWESEWLIKALYKIGQNSDHTFFMLTKEPSFYTHFNNLSPFNLWFGVTLACEYKAIYSSGRMRNIRGVKSFASIEPILERIQPNYLGGGDTRSCAYRWIIIGAETGNRKSKVIPQREWIAEIVDYCKANQIPVFLKDSLREIWGEKLIQEYPGGKNELG